jgi:hypothetical protein
MRPIAAGSALAACVAIIASGERRAPAARAPAVACSYARVDTVALAASARDTVARLKGRAQRVTEITRLVEGIAFRTEDVDSTAFHNGGAVSFDCAKRVTAVWLDGG